MTELNQKIAVAGASSDTSRYWYRIYKDTKAYGYTTYCVNSRLDSFGEDKFYHTLGEIKDTLDVLVLVVPPQLTMPLVEEAVKLKIKQIWFQPGTFDERAAEFAKNNGIEVFDSCFMLENSIW